MDTSVRLSPAEREEDDHFAGCVAVVNGDGSLDIVSWVDGKLDSSYSREEWVSVTIER